MAKLRKAVNAVLGFGDEFFGANASVALIPVEAPASLPHAPGSFHGRGKMTPTKCPKCGTETPQGAETCPACLPGQSAGAPLRSNRRVAWLVVIGVAAVTAIGVIAVLGPKLVAPPPAANPSPPPRKPADIPDLRARAQQGNASA